MINATMKWTLTSLALLALAGLTTLGAGCEDTPDDEADMHEHQAPPAGAQMVQVTNDTCPIMGSQIDPNKVPASLTRQWQGQTIGFCCPGCPEQWDELTDEQKAQKLAAAQADR